MAKAKKITETIEIKKSSSTFTLAQSDRIVINSDGMSEVDGIFEKAGVKNNVIKVLGDIKMSGDQTGGVSFSGQNTTVKIGARSHVAATVAIEANNDANGFRIVNQGDLSGLAGIIASGSGVIVNKGNISGLEAGVVANHESIRIINNGYILGNTAVSMAGSDSAIINGKNGYIAGSNGIYVNQLSADETIHITNRGTITAYNNAVYAGDAAVDVIIKNTGVMSGDIYLGAGDDVVNTARGTVLGEIYGGKGDDVFILKSAATVIHENAAEGADTVKIAGHYTLGDNIENLTLLGDGKFAATGNGMDNLLIGNKAGNFLYGHAGNDTLDGAAGNDTLVGGSGMDVFIFKNGGGKDTIVDFVHGEDVIKILGIDGIASFGDVAAASAASGGDLVITLGNGDRLTITGGATMTFTDADFDFFM